MNRIGSAKDRKQ